MRTMKRGKVGNLPEQVTSFVGRPQQLAQATALLRTGRLVTLVGPAGVGKTRLALETAATRRRAYACGVWLVELASLHDSELLAHTIVAALGLRDQAGKAPVAALIDYFGARPLLLVLDNCEHLVDASAEMAYQLLRKCLSLQILATSRESLGVSGEVLLSVPPLDVPDPGRRLSARAVVTYSAVALFMDRARSAVPGFELTDENNEAVTAICRRLDGLPLAIELAAARLRVLTPGQILDRLDDRYRLLTVGPRDTPARHQTLRACIEWSFDLCMAAERTLWARISVFAGSFEIDAVEGVCIDEGLTGEDLLELVNGLVDKSVLLADTRGETARYRLLETVREYGLERLVAAGAEIALRRRHCHWYHELVLRAEADLITERQVAWQTRLDRELPNIRAAMEFCLAQPDEVTRGLGMAVAMHPYWTRGRLSEGCQWLDRMLRRQVGPPTPLRLLGLYDATMISGFHGDVPAAAAYAKQAHEIAGELGDDRSRTLAVQAEANMSVFAGDLSHAADRYERVLDGHRADGNLPRLLEALIAVAFMGAMLGNWPRVTDSCEEILAITEPHSEAWYRSYAMFDLGLAAWRQGEPDKAAGQLRQALRLKMLVDDPMSAVMTLEALAWVAVDRGDHDHAAVLLGAGESLSRDVGTPTATFGFLLQFHDECEQQARRALGERAFLKAFAYGRDQLSFADAVAYAMKEAPQTTLRAQVTGATGPLSNRERQVAGFIAEGLTNKEIADRLLISRRTVESHVEHILLKLCLNTRAQVATYVVAEKTDPAPEPVAGHHLDRSGHDRSTSEHAGHDQ